MKKLIAVFLCPLMVILLFLPASASSSNPPCAHSNVKIYENGKVGETCTTETYIL